MNHKLLNRKTIRNYLNYFSSTQIDNVITYTLEYGILILLSKFNINSLSAQFLAELVSELKEKNDDDQLKKRGKSFDFLRKTNVERGIFEEDDNENEIKRNKHNQNERFITSYINKNQKSEGNSKAIQPIYSSQYTCQNHDSNYQNECQVDSQTISNLNNKKNNEIHNSKSNKNNKYNTQNILPTQTQFPNKTNQFINTYQSNNSNQKQSPTKSNLSKFSESKNVSASFEVLETSQRPTNKEEKRELIKNYERKIREKIKETKNLSFAYTPTKKKVVYVNRDDNLNNKQQKDKYAKVESKIKDDIKRDKERKRNEDELLKEYKYGFCGKDEYIDKQKDQKGQRNHKNNISNTDYINQINISKQQPFTLGEGNNINTIEERNKDVKQTNQSKSIEENLPFRDYLYKKSMNNYNRKFILLNDKNDNKALYMSNQFIYPIDEWKYGFQFQTDKRELRKSHENMKNISEEKEGCDYSKTDGEKFTLQEKLKESLHDMNEVKNKELDYYYNIKYNTASPLLK